MGGYTHLHLHTQYSILDGAAKISTLMTKVQEFGMHAIAITDHGNMYGVLDFLKHVDAVNESGYELKPIIGCEIYVATGSRFDKKGETGQEWKSPDSSCKKQSRISQPGKNSFSRAP